MEILRVEDLHVYFPIKKGLFGRVIGYVKAVNGVSFAVNSYDGLALVGETGSGKTTILRTILKLEKPTRGRIFFKNKDIFLLTKKEESWYRRSVQAVFQNPFQSLNPRMKVFDIVAEPIRKHQKLEEKDIRKKVSELLELVGLPLSTMNQYPSNLSGGQAQRVALARALAVNPELILLDEPTSALDVSIQAQIINLLQELREKFNMTYLLVTHDLSIVRYIVKNILVLYRGNVMEVGSVDTVFQEPLHPYTQALMASFPDPIKGLTYHTNYSLLKEDKAYAEALGCKLAHRCRYATKICYEKKPLLVNVKNRLVACWLYI
ncbi:MAG: ATP-binding cassette domain-containing protein [Desulfurococcaceae archaeon]